MVFFLTSCDVNDLQKQVTTANDEIISPRGDCDDCPDEDDCCCYVTLNNGDNSASLFFCGTSDGGVVNCSSLPCVATSYTNKGHTITLTTPFNFKYNFCVLENTEFFFLNTHATDVADIKVSCQRGQSTPQEYAFQLAANGGRAYLLTNGTCVVSECDP